MSRLFDRLLPANSFARHVATVAGATAFSQAVGIMALPLLTRLYSPDEYGAAAVYASVVGLILVVSAMRYELAIPLPRVDKGALHVAVLALAVMAGVSLIASLTSPLIGLWLGKETGLSRWVFSIVVGVGVLTGSAYQVTNYWAVRKSKFGTIARTRIQQGIAGPASQLALGFAGFGAIGLIVGQIIGQCAGLTRLATGMIDDNHRAGHRLHLRGLAWAAKRYRRFPLYDSWAGLLNVAGGQAPVLLFATLFSPVLAGYYALSLRILSAPLALIGTAVSQVLVPRIVEAHRHGDAGNLILKLFRILAWLSFFPFTVAALTAHEIVPFVLGAQWTPATQVVAWTALWTACQFVTSPLSIAMTNLEAQRLHTGVQFTLFTLRTGAILIGASLASPEFAVIGFAVASIVGYGIYLLAIGAVTGVRPSQFGLALLGPLLLSSACALVVYVASFSKLIEASFFIIFLSIWILTIIHGTMRIYR